MNLSARPRRSGARQAGSLLVRRPGAAQALDRGTSLLGLDPALARSPRRPGRAPPHWLHRRLANELDQALACILTVALLGTVALRRDDQHALARQPPASEAFEPGA